MAQKAERDRRMAETNRRIAERMAEAEQPIAQRTAANGVSVGLLAIHFPSRSCALRSDTRMALA
jgi:hypothetical protein